MDIKAAKIWLLVKMGNQTMGSSSNSQRSSNFELLRIIAMIAIIAHHSVFHGLAIPLSKKLFLNTTFEQALFFGGKFGVAIFIILSGYFLINREFKLKSFLRLIFQYLFYSCIILFFVSYFNLVKINYKLVVTTLFPLTGYSWFADAYILLYIFHPFLNKFILNLKKKEMEIFLLLGAIIWFLIPTTAFIFNINMYMNFSNAVLFIYFYCLGAYINLFNKQSDCSGRIALFGYLLYVCLSVIFFRVNLNVPYINQGAYFLGTQNSIFILVVSLCTFLYFKSIQIAPNKIINSISATVFGIYLIHDNDLIRRFLWNNLVVLKDHYFQSYFIFYASAVILTIFFVCSGIDYLRIKFLEKPLFEKFEFEIQHLEKKLKCIMK